MEVTNTEFDRLVAISYGLRCEVEKLKQRLNSVAPEPRKPRQWVWHEDTKVMCEQGKCYHIGGVIVREVLPEDK